MNQPGRCAPQDAVHLEPLIVKWMHIMPLDLDDLVDEGGRRVADCPPPLHDAGREARGPRFVAAGAVRLRVTDCVVVDGLVELAEDADQEGLELGVVCVCG